MVTTSSCILHRATDTATRAFRNSILRASRAGSCSQQKYFGIRSFGAEANQKLTGGRINHIALAVPNLKTASNFYRDALGATVSAAQAQPAHGVATVFASFANTAIELLHPLDKTQWPASPRPLDNFLEKNPTGGFHHVCFEVDDIHAAIDSLRNTHHIRTLKPEPVIGAHGKLVVFLHPKDCHGVLIELQQSH